MRLASTAPDDEKIEHKLNANIPKSPSFHSGLDLVAGTGNKYVNISKFSFANDMNGNNSKTAAGEPQSNQQTIFSFTKVRASSTDDRPALPYVLAFITVFYAIKSTEQLEYHVQHSANSAASEFGADPATATAAAERWFLRQAEQRSSTSCFVCAVSCHTVDCERDSSEIFAADEHFVIAIDGICFVLQPADDAQAVGANYPVDGTAVPAATARQSEPSTWPQQLRQSTIKSRRSAASVAQRWLQARWMLTLCSFYAFSITKASVSSVPFNVNGRRARKWVGGGDIKWFRLDMNWCFAPLTHHAPPQSTTLSLQYSNACFFLTRCRSRRWRTWGALYQEDPPVLRAVRLHWAFRRSEMEGGEAKRPSGDGRVHQQHERYHHRGRVSRSDSDGECWFFCWHWPNVKL